MTKVFIAVKPVRIQIAVGLGSVPRPAGFSR